MPRVDKRKPTYGNADAPGSGPRARTYRLLLAEAMKLVKSGRVPSVAEVAVKSGVSRATAYRYFESRSKLISAVIGEGLAPVRTTETAGVAGPQRLRELFEKTFPLFKENERHMRAALMLALEHEGLERAGLLEEEVFRRGHRRDILRRASAPLAAQLGAAGLRPPAEGAVAHLRHRDLRRAEGHLGRHRPRGRGPRALDARRDRHGGAARCGRREGEAARATRAATAAKSTGPRTRGPGRKTSTP